MLSSKNKIIVKNTVMLYFRMALIMVVSLYTSRVILNSLGVVDYGVYNVVAGVVVLFSFLNSALMNASQRYMSIAVGKDSSSELQKVFSACLLLHLIFCAIVILMAETLGLWFLNNKLSIPPDRLYAAKWVYQLAILNTCVNVVRVPYNSMIIAKEEMSFFAYLSILETVLKLSVSYVIMLILYDRLITYSILLLVISLIITGIYAIKCHVSYSIALSIRSKRGFIGEIASFSGWNILGGIADIGYKQGTNIILNIFSGVTVNAAMAIAMQVRAAIYSFVSNLQIAANPQIIKSYSSEDYGRYSTLVYRISKYSFFLIYAMALPIILNIHILLDFWLKSPPLYAYTFCTLTLMFCLVDSLSGPLWTSMQAMGDIRKYQIVISILILLNLPLSYIALYQGLSPNCVLYIQIMICFITLGVRLFFSWYYAQLDILSYLKEVLIPIVGVVILSLPIPLFISMKFDGGEQLAYTMISSVVLIGGSLWFVGLKSNERNVAIAFLKSKFR